MLLLTFDPFMLGVMCYIINRKIHELQIHFETTGPEIWEDTMGSVDVLVAAVGTGGTVTGTGHYLKMMNKEIKVRKFFDSLHIEC